MAAARGHMPLFLTFREKVEGNGFLADVYIRGRVLAVQEGKEDVWMYGVQPGDIAGSGKNEGEAYLQILQTFKAVLFDISAGSADFSAFKREVHRFVGETSKDADKKWWKAVERVRSGDIQVEGMIRRKAELPAYPEIRRVEKLAAKNNILDLEKALAA